MFRVRYAHNLHYTRQFLSMGCILIVQHHFHKQLSSEIHLGRNKKEDRKTYLQATQQEQEKIVWDVNFILDTIKMNHT